MIGIGGEILNFVGGTIRWIYGSLWRTIFKKPKFKFKEYISGPNNPDYYDKFGHHFNNKIIAIISIGILLSLL